MGPVLPHLITLAKESAFLSSPGVNTGREHQQRMTKKMFVASYDVVLSTVTFSRYVSGISFITLLVGSLCFRSFVFSVGNEPTLPRAGLPTAECEGS